MDFFGWIIKSQFIQKTKKREMDLFQKRLIKRITTMKPLPKNPFDYDKIGAFLEPFIWSCVAINVGLTLYAMLFI